MSPKMYVCKFCKTEVSIDAYKCPICYTKNLKLIKSKIIVLLYIFILLFGISKYKNIGILIAKCYQTKAQPVNSIMNKNFVKINEMFSYSDLLKNSDDFKGKKAAFTGRIISITNYKDKLYLIVNITKENLDYENPVYVIYENENSEEFSIGDIITMCGELSGIKEFKNYRIPQFNMYYFDKIL